LAFGHSFATGNEHDQAMAAYFTAAQLMKGYVHVFIDLFAFIPFNSLCFEFETVVMFFV
jgi:hypothetical protein